MINILMRYENNNTIPVIDGQKMRQFKTFDDAKKFVVNNFRYELTPIYIDIDRQIVIDS